MNNPRHRVVQSLQSSWDRNDFLNGAVEALDVVLPIDDIAHFDIGSDGVVPEPFFEVVTLDSRYGAEGRWRGFYRPRELNWRLGHRGVEVYRQVGAAETCHHSYPLASSIVW